MNDNIRVVENKEKDVNLEQPKFVLPGFSMLSENILKKSRGDADDLRAKVVFCKAGDAHCKKTSHPNQIFSNDQP